MMQIVIDISEETYNEVCWRGLFLCPRGEKELVKAIKKGTPLEQEPKTDTLDKIRAEIKAKCCITVGRENDAAITLHDVFDIIDKYKAESKVQEC